MKNNGNVDILLSFIFGLIIGSIACFGIIEIKYNNDREKLIKLVNDSQQTAKESILIANEYKELFFNEK